MSSPKPRGIVVFSGGSAANNLVDVFTAVTNTARCPLSYVIPISDNGGSSSEIIRVIGGPGIGDVRSRLVRLIPEDHENPDTEKAALRTFFNHRLPSDSDAARLQWLQIVEGRHSLWDHISSPRKELIRSFLNSLNLEIVKRARPSSVYNFSSASIGNLFLTGYCLSVVLTLGDLRAVVRPSADGRSARLFSGSFESAIYLLSSICRLPDHVSVLPAINSNFTHHIRAGLADGTTITGQNAISHPSVSTPLSNDDDQPWAQAHEDEETAAHDSIEDANLPGSLPSLRKQYITFSKSAEDALPARIERIWYINPYGQEIRPAANLKVIEATHSASCIVYSIGSLFTSIVPSLVLRGVGDAVAGCKGNKVLILNSTNDRETGLGQQPFSAVDFVAAIADACSDSRGMPRPVLRELYSTYVSHIIYLESSASPSVDRGELTALGIDTVRVYGRKAPSGMVMYDEKALVGALEAIVGKKTGRGDRSRRNTLEL